MPENQNPAATAAPAAPPAAAPPTEPANQAAAPPAAPPAIPAGADAGFMQKIIATTKEYMEGELLKFRKELKDNLSKIMAEEVKKAQDEAVKALKTGLGLTTDPVVHVSEIPEMVRKMLQEGTNDATKRSQNPIGNKPAEGEDVTKKGGKALPSADEMFKEQQGKIGGP